MAAAADDSASGVHALVQARAGAGRTAVTVHLIAQGRDLVLLVQGGQAHIGALAVRAAAAGTLGQPLAALVVAPGHKEGPLAEEGAAMIAAASGRACAVIAGIHQDSASPAEIAAIVANVRACYAEVAARLRAQTAASPGPERIA